MNLQPLITAIKELYDRAPTGELAFLCLIGTTENHIRDLVAYSIATQEPHIDAQGLPLEMAYFVVSHHSQTN